MATKRRLQILNVLLKKQISNIILEQERPSKKVFTTITKVETSSDLSVAKVYISVWPDSRYQEIFSLLQHDIKKIQRQIDEILSIRVVPKIVFLEDKGEKKASRVEEIINKINNKAT